MRKVLAVVVICVAASLRGQAAPESPPSGSVPEPPLSPELEAAWRKYEQLIHEYPDRPLLHYNFGNLAYAAGQYQKALEEYRAALSAPDPQSQARALYNLGNSLFRAGQIPESLVFYRRALELNPQDHDARVNYEVAQRLAEQQQSQSQPNTENKQDTEREQEQKQSGDRDQDRTQDDQSDRQDQQNGLSAQQQPDDTPQDREANRQTEDEQQPQAPQPLQQEDEKDLAREEAEAILNALRADEENLMKRRYRPPEPLKLEKDW